jgi:hypothetical protein
VECSSEIAPLNNATNHAGPKPLGIYEKQRKENIGMSQEVTELCFGLRPKSSSDYPTLTKHFTLTYYGLNIHPGCQNQNATLENTKMRIFLE